MPQDPTIPGRMGASASPDALARRMERIQRLLIQRLTPSLLLDTGDSEARELGGVDRSDALVAMVLQGREEEAKSDIAELFARGETFEQLQLGLLAPAAQKLGILWESDALSFVDVTLATGTLQRLMHFVSLDLDRAPIVSVRPRCILIFTEPGSEHAFGATMAARIFEKAGWTVLHAFGGDRNAQLALARNNRIDVLGLSLGRADMAESAGRLLSDLRSASANSNVVAIGGGSALVRRPELLEPTGVDAVLTTAARANSAVDDLIARKLNRS